MTRIDAYALDRMLYPDGVRLVGVLTEEHSAKVHIPRAENNGGKK